MDNTVSGCCGYPVRTFFIWVSGSKVIVNTNAEIEYRNGQLNLYVMIMCCWNILTLNRHFPDRQRMLRRHAWFFIGRASTPNPVEVHRRYQTGWFFFFPTRKGWTMSPIQETYYRQMILWPIFVRASHDIKSRFIPAIPSRQYARYASYSSIISTESM